MTKSFKRINPNWFATTENLLVISSISGSVASIIFQQFAFAAITSIPLSLAVSFNSYNRRRLDEVTQQHQASVIQLEQQSSNNREFLNQVIYSLPTRSELADTQSRLETRNTAFAEQLDSLKKQFNSHLELQQINHLHLEVAEVQQRLITLENFLQLELQERVTQVEQLVNNLQVSSTKEFTQLHKSFSEEIQSISQQVQGLTSKTEAFSPAYIEIKNQQLFVDLQLSLKNYTEQTQHFSKEVDTLRQQIQAVSSSVSERIAALRVEFQKHLLSVEKSEHKIYTGLYELTNWCDKLEKELERRLGNNNLTKSIKPITQELKGISSKEVQYVCEHCNESHETKPVKGGYFSNYNFCSPNCKQEYERMNGLL